MIVSNNSMVEDFYDYPNSTPKDYQGIRSEGDTFFLNTPLFRESRLTNNTLSVLPDGDERKRNMILTLVFLDFVLKLEEHEEMEEAVKEINSILNEELKTCDELMETIEHVAVHSADPTAP